MRRSVFILLFSICASGGSPSFAENVVEPSSPVEIPGRPAKFDFMGADSSRGRILAAHKEAESLTILETQTGKLLPEIKVGHVQGVSIDPVLRVYVLGDDDEKKVVILDSTTFKTLGEVVVPGAVDAVVVNPKTHLAYADADDGRSVWVIDLQSKKWVTTISLPGIPEVIDTIQLLIAYTKILKIRIF